MRKAPNDAATKWPNALPLRWARNAAIALFVFSAASQAEQASGGMFALLIGATSVSGAIGACFLGRWAVWSLKTRYESDASGMAGAILNTWVSGALLIIGVPVILFDLAVQLGLPGQPIGIWRWLLSLPVSVAVAGLVGVASKIGLNRVVKTAARANGF